MQQCFRVTLWMFLLGYLHVFAKPIIHEEAAQSGNPPQMCFNLNMGDLSLYRLDKDVSCGQNVTFTSPSNVQKHCYAAALETFMEGLENASNNCELQHERIYDTIDTMEESFNRTLNLELAKLSKCKWESKNFSNFKSDLQVFIEKLYAENRVGC